MSTSQARDLLRFAVHSFKFGFRLPSSDVLKISYRNEHQVDKIRVLPQFLPIALQKSFNRLDKLKIPLQLLSDFNSALNRSENMKGMLSIIKGRLNALSKWNLNS